MVGEKIGKVDASAEQAAEKGQVWDSVYRYVAPVPWMRSDRLSEVWDCMSSGESGESE